MVLELAKSHESPQRPVPGHVQLTFDSLRYGDLVQIVHRARDDKERRMGNNPEYVGRFIGTNNGDYQFGSRGSIFGYPVDFEILPHDVVAITVLERTLRDSA